MGDLIGMLLNYKAINRVSFDYVLYWIHYLLENRSVSLSTANDLPKLFKYIKTWKKILLFHEQWYQPNKQYGKNGGTLGGEVHLEGDAGK